MKVLLGQAMIGAQNKCLGVADDDVQPMEKAGMGIVGFVFMGIAFQRRDVTAIAIAVDLAAIVKSGMVNFFTYACLILSVTRIFRKRGLPRSSKDNATKTFAFSVPHPLFFPVVGPPKYASSNSMMPHSRWLPSR